MVEYSEMADSDGVRSFFFATAKEALTYLMIMIYFNILLRFWFGNAADIASALQPLQLVSIIEFWANKSSSTRTQEVKMEQRLPPPPDECNDDQLRDTVITVEGMSDASILECDPVQRPCPPCHPSLATSGQFPCQRNPLPQRSNLPVALPELDNYTWLLDRDPGNSDLLIVRIGEKGKILRPIIVFDSARWKNSRFQRILEDEEPRLPENVITKFTFDAVGQHHTYTSYYTQRGIHFYAIVPLDPRDYTRQWKLSGEADRLFGPLETLLGISELVLKARNESKIWCECRSEWNKFSTSMILCDNMKCKLGWYHKRCVGMDEDEDPEDEWLCRRCARLPRKKLDIAEDMDMPYGKLAEASSNRIQLAKALNTVWHSHSWPSRKEIVNMFERISHNMEILNNIRMPFSPRYRRASDITNYWTIRKDRRSLDLVAARSKKLVPTYRKEKAVDDSTSNSDDAA